MPTPRTSSKPGTKKAAPAKAAPRPVASAKETPAAEAAKPAPAKKKADPKDTVSLIDEKEKVVRPRPAEGEVKTFSGLPPISKIKAGPAIARGACSRSRASRNGLS